MKRSRIRRRSTAGSRLDRAMKPPRDAFALQFPFCWRCGATSDLCVDEMVSGWSDRTKGIQHRCAWTRLCGECNTGPLNGSAEAVIKLKLAMKWIHDRPHFDRRMVNALRGRHPDAIRFREVVPDICRLLDGGRAG